MKIDNRIFIPFAMPFVFLGMARVLWFLAGAEWSDPGGAAFMCMIAGVGLGGTIACLMMATGDTIGFIRIGGKKDGCP